MRKNFAQNFFMREMCIRDSSKDFKVIVVFHQLVTIPFKFPYLFFLFTQSFLLFLVLCYFCLLYTSKEKIKNKAETNKVGAEEAASEKEDEEKEEIKFVSMINMC